MVSIEVVMTNWIAIDWNTPIYYTVRNNFLSQFNDDSDTVPKIKAEWDKELERHNAKIKEITPHWSSPYVTDALGMCSYHRIIFADEKDYTWFILRWS